MQHCPKCSSEHLHRSRSRSRWERWRKEITGKRLFRCNNCGWRGWAVDSGPLFTEGERRAADRALAPEPPNLERMGFARDAKNRRDPRVADLDATFFGSSK